MIREIVCYPADILACKAKAVDSVSAELESLASDMVETMYARDGIGLAAPQVGVGLRLIVVDVSGPEVRSDLMVMVNPRIVSARGEISSEEGCLSVREMVAKVSRSESVVVEYQNLSGEPQKLEASDLLAICLQHEIDHLDGVLFIDRISNLKRSLYERKVKKWIKSRGFE